MFVLSCRRAAMLACLLGSTMMLPIPAAHAQMSVSGGPGAGAGQPSTDEEDVAPKPKPEVPKGNIAAPTLAPLSSGAITDDIFAIVNGEIVTRGDIDNRARLFAISAGLPLSPDVMARLRGQIGRELIDDRLRAQEIRRSKIVISDAEVAASISEVEQRNGLKKGGLRERLEGQGVDFATMIAQLRDQLGWSRVLREHLADRARITPADIDREEAQFNAEKGQKQYLVSEIFISAEDPTRMQEARHFADTVIEQLHGGAPFGIVAAEFSQSQTALQGGDLGWVRPEQLDPQVAAVINQMPVGAISNPIAVAGGYSVITVHEVRTIGEDMATVVNLRQAFFPFSAALDPANPTEQQKAQLAAATSFAKSVTSCDAMAKENDRQGSKHQSDPGDVREDRLNPNMKAVLASLQPGQVSKPLVTPDGVMLVMVCTRAQKNMAAMTRDDIGNQLLEQRVELISRQLQQNLKRRALIDQRG
jgi:peptidyl-prolyl cis-trans isomerase SurA